MLAIEEAMYDLQIDTCCSKIAREYVVDVSSHKQQGSRVQSCFMFAQW